MTNQGRDAVILCVDDEPSGLLMRKLLLESRGYRVLTAESGEAGIAILSAEAIDLVLLDYMMPGADGGAVAEAMKKIKPSVPILMLSAYVDLPSETAAHVDRYVIKGQSPPALLSAVAELLQGSATGSNHDPAA
jgi:CheY-like chemotaxis protein